MGKKKISKESCLPLWLQKYRFFQLYQYLAIISNSLIVWYIYIYFLCKYVFVSIFRSDLSQFNFGIGFINSSFVARLPRV